MIISPFDLMEPEETVGNLWHDYASRLGLSPVFPDAVVALSSLQPGLAIFFRALGGAKGTELREAAPLPVRHRRSLRRRIGTGRETFYQAGFDGECLRLPPQLDCFDDPSQNRAAYFWLTAMAAVCRFEDLPQSDCDELQIAINTALTERVRDLCPGLFGRYTEMVAKVLANRPRFSLPPKEAVVEAVIRSRLAGETVNPMTRMDDGGGGGRMSFVPVPLWLHLSSPCSGAPSQETTDEAGSPPPNAPTASRKMAFRRDLDQANRKDNLIVHRFESILSWVESMNLNRSVDDDDDENAQKAADDQDNITLTRNDKRAATRLRLHLDLSPADADHERLSAQYTYPEWNYRSRSYMDDHCRVLEAEVAPATDLTFQPDAKRLRAVRRQFEVLRPRRIMQPCQIDGTELDIDALIAARADLAATGQGSDRIWQSSRQVERDLSVAFLIDTSRSTEATVGDISVIEVAREALAVLAGGIDAAGDRLGIWGFSSLRRNRVFVTRIKGFDQPMNQAATDRIGALKPGYYTRLGAAIRHASHHLSEEKSARRLLIVLTDGKPNDLDHYEGQHGIEDSRVAVAEARRNGQIVHGIVVDEDGQDWFARIFGRGGFHLLPHPQRLTMALPEIYRRLTVEN
ncbi:nitric oxide reductase activation protein NorD [Notoacmeibacter ruber]|uniref:VWA domain-containing protein n=1 Tax=Notoacmeibacter ruber TaxID=2670375 RepID=A0A3L7JD45_9HYPH|nr:VWA domain-containing protein [Notoacmeibacter ruber]RLQ88593.1 VWA domain-containing protein [Notoacmeibacter ruber]